MKRALKIRRSIVVAVAIVAVLFGITQVPDFWQTPTTPILQNNASGDAVMVLNQLEVNGRAPKTGYTREQFGGDWTIVGGCDMRNTILSRDLENDVVNEKCHVLSGTLNDPYTGEIIQFQRGAATSDDIQIDHVVALSDAWQKGAQQLTPQQREQFANDPLELLAVDGRANQQKSDSDAASWLPPQKAFRCQYVARQIAVKKKYALWVTQAEKDAMLRVLSACPGQVLP